MRQSRQEVGYYLTCHCTLDLKTVQSNNHRHVKAGGGSGECGLERVYVMPMRASGHTPVAWQVVYRLTAHEFCQFEVELFDMSRHALPYRARTADMSDKKRKRHAENGERPKKKAVALPQGNVRVDMVESKETLGPVLGM